MSAHQRRQRRNWFALDEPKEEPPKKDSPEPPKEPPGGEDITGYQS